jgi:hypothetical protein
MIKKEEVQDGESFGLPEEDVLLVAARADIQFSNLQWVWLYEECSKNEWGVNELAVVVGERKDVPSWFVEKACSSQRNDSLKYWIAMHQPLTESQIMKVWDGDRWPGGRNVRVALFSNEKIQMPEPCIYELITAIVSNRDKGLATDYIRQFEALLMRSYFCPTLEQEEALLKTACIQSYSIKFIMECKHPEWDHQREKRALEVLVGIPKRCSIGKKTL